MRLNSITCNIASEVIDSNVSNNTALFYLKYCEDKAIFIFDRSALKDGIQNIFNNYQYKL